MSASASASATTANFINRGVQQQIQPQIQQQQLLHRPNASVVQPTPSLTVQASTHSPHAQSQPNVPLNFLLRSGATATNANSSSANSSAISANITSASSNLTPSTTANSSLGNLPSSGIVFAPAPSPSPSPSVSQSAANLAAPNSNANRHAYSSSLGAWPMHPSASHPLLSSGAYANGSTAAELVSGQSAVQSVPSTGRLAFNENSALLSKTVPVQYSATAPSSAKISSPGTVPASSASSAHHTSSSISSTVSASKSTSAASVSSTSASSSANNGDDEDDEMGESIVLKDGKRYNTASKQYHVGLCSLFAVVYFCVCTGPYGLEDGARAGGAFWLLITLIVVSVLENLPIGLLTCELASAMPQNGGYIIWVSRAFGNFWGFQEGWLSWCGLLVDCTLYVFIFSAYFEGLLAFVAGWTFQWLQKFIIRILLVLSVSVLNVMNLQVVGVMSVLFAIVSLAPFFLMALIGLNKLDFSQIFTEIKPIESVDWGLLLSTVLWVSGGWDSPGTVAGDVKSPRKTYPTAVYLAVPAAFLTNILPLLVALSTFAISGDANDKEANNAAKDPATSVDSTIWSTRLPFWANIAYALSGWKLWSLVIMAALVTSLGLLNLLTTSSAWALYALSLPGLLDFPLLTRLQSKFRTPWICLLINALIMFVCSTYTFSGLIQVTMALNMILLSLQCLSLVWLRVIDSTMKRPYRIPFNTLALAAFMAPHLLLTVFLLYSIDAFIRYIVAAVVLSGFLAYFLARLTVRLSLEPNTQPPNVDLVEVFEVVHEQVEGVEPEEVVDLGFPYSAQVEALPQSLVVGQGVPADLHDEAAAVPLLQTISTDEAKPVSEKVDKAEAQKANGAKTKEEDSKTSESSETEEDDEEDGEDEEGEDDEEDEAEGDADPDADAEGEEGDDDGDEEGDDEEEDDEDEDEADTPKPKPSATVAVPSSATASAPAAASAPAPAPASSSPASAKASATSTPPMIGQSKNSPATPSSSSANSISSAKI